MLVLDLFTLLILPTQKKTALSSRWGGTLLALNSWSASSSRPIKRKPLSEGKGKKRIKVIETIQKKKRGHFSSMLPSTTPTDVDIHSPSMELSVRSLGMVKREWVEFLTGHQYITHQSK